MIPARFDLGQAFRSRIGSLLLAVLLLGAVFHGLHHLQDPACGSEHAPHACVACAGLHAASVLAAETHAPTPHVHAWVSVPGAATEPVLATAWRAAAPRAPPAI